MQDHNKILQRELTHVYWMGGITMRGKKFDCRYPGCNLWTLSLSGR